MRRLRLAQATLLMLVSFGSWMSPAQAAEEEQYYELMKTFVDTFEQIERNYVKEVDRRELLEAAVRGMLLKLDPYSSYIDAEELDRFNQQVEQEFGGVGIQVTVDPKTRQLTVMTPLPGTPAYEAGVRAGDRIMEIMGKPTSEFPEGQELETAVRMLKGKPGEEVELGVMHEGENTIEKLRMKRDIIHVSTCLGDCYNPDGSWNYLLDPDKKIGYIRLTHFSRNTAEELEKSIKNLQEHGMRALILDLRFNPGGLLRAAVEVSDLFLEEGNIVSTKGRNTEEQVWSATKPGTYTGFPMIVLVNRYSASASEIVSAALQDHKRAIIIGERTWGKGSVQNVIELEGGSTALKLTTAGYHRPSGKNIHRFPDSKETDEWGVVPDTPFEVKLTMKEMEQYLNYRRERDVLRKNGPPESAFQDPQLVKAIDVVLGELGERPASAEEPANAQKAEQPKEKGEDEKDSSATLPRLPLSLPRAG